MRTFARKMLFLPLALVALTQPSQAVDLDEVSVQKFSAWEALVLLNNSSNKHLCAAQTRTSDGSVFRINFYSTENAFAEILPNRTTLPIDATFLTFKSDTASAQVVGKVFSDAIIIELDKDYVARGLLSLLAQAKSIELIGKSGRKIVTIPAAGSKRAIENLIKCSRVVHEYRWMDRRTP